MAMATTLSITAADHARERNRRNGGHYFDADTMRFFGSEVVGGINLPDGSTVVVMTNRDGGMVFEGRRYAVLDGKRHYYLIIVTPDGEIEDGPEKYDVNAGTGYYMTKSRAAIEAIEYAERAAPAAHTLGCSIAGYCRC